MKHLLAPAAIKGAVLKGALLAATATLAAAAPASAQSADEKINMVIAYSEDECPTAQPGEVVICEILVEADRYRIPSNLRQSNSPENTAWAERVESIKYVGDFGAMSCSPAGLGGFTGCTQKFIEAAYKDRAEADNVRFSALIEEARAERLSTIDEDAAAEQERVEMIEREYMERLERERAGELPAVSDPSLAPPPIDTEARQPPVAPAKPGPFDDGDDEQVPIDAIPPAEAPSGN